MKQFQGIILIIFHITDYQLYENCSRIQEQDLYLLIQISMIKRSNLIRKTTIDSFDLFRSISFFPFFFYSLSILFLSRVRSEIPDERNSLWPQHGCRQQLSRDTNYKRMVHSRSNTRFFFHVAPRNNYGVGLAKSHASLLPFLLRRCIGLLNGPYKVYERSTEKFLWRRAAPASFPSSSSSFSPFTPPFPREALQKSAIVFDSRPLVNSWPA